MADTGAWMEGEREQERENKMAKGSGDSMKAFLEAADSASNWNSLDGESQDAVVFHCPAPRTNLSSAHAQIAALESQNAKLQRDNDQAETEAAAAKLKVRARVLQPPPARA